jgi:predicted component of type VI protein secretion system
MSPAASRTNGSPTMNYVLQVIRGRSASTTLKLTNGVTSIGRHDDCVIRIKSSQVSRRHCEIFEVEDELTIRDLGSSNGTFVNGKRVSGQLVLKAGDELTVGAVSLRVARLGQPAPVPPLAPAFKPKAGDTAVNEALALDEEEEEFEMEFDDGEAVPEVEGIPLADDEAAPPVGAKAPKAPTPAPQEAKPAPKSKAGNEEDAISEFLLDLNLDDDE